jgi:hypothetical protein
MTEEDAHRRDPVVGTGADFSALKLQQAIAQVCETATEASRHRESAAGQIMAAE